MIHRTSTLFLLGLFATGLFIGCESTIVPLRPVQRIEKWVPDTAATSPASQPALASVSSQPASSEPATSAPATLASASSEPTSSELATSAPATLASTQPTTMPGHTVVTVIDPNETVRYVYKAGYDTVWQQAMLLLAKTGFTLDRKDYRLGVLTTMPQPSAQIVEFWKPEHTNAHNAIENTLNSQDRLIRVTISNVDGKPDFYAIAVQVIVERETNPSEVIGGPIFVTGSGFGDDRNTLHSDYEPIENDKGRWVVIGHDPTLENKLLDELFTRI